MSAVRHEPLGATRAPAATSSSTSVIGPTANPVPATAACKVPCRGGPSILFVHGLGGAKENSYAAFQSPALHECTLLAFDEPGTGLAVFDPEAGLNVSALAGMTQNVGDRFLSGPYFLTGVSMGGLITLLQLRRHGVGRIRGLINFEGNLCAEDCMFSRAGPPRPSAPLSRRTGR